MACPNCGYHRDPVPCPPEPPVGTWVRDRFGATHYRRADGWAAAPTGFYAGARWAPMWEARGPLVECGPWGAALATTTTTTTKEA